MIDKDLIPTRNTRIHNQLNSRLENLAIKSQDLQLADRLLKRVDEEIGEKIKGAVTVSEYFNELWTTKELDPLQKNVAMVVIELLEGVHHIKTDDIETDIQQFPVKKVKIDRLLTTDKYELTAYDEFNLNENMKKLIEEYNLTNRVKRQHVDHHVSRCLNQASHPNIKQKKLFHYCQGVDTEEQEEEKAKQERAKKFLKKVQSEKEEFERKLKELEILNQQKTEWDKQLLKVHEEVEERKKNEQKRKEIMERLQVLEQRELERQEAKERWEQIKLQSKKKKFLYQRFLEQDKIEQERELQERKEKLRQIKDVYKPIDFTELKQWNSEIKKRKEEFVFTKQLNRTPSPEASYHKPAYHSIYHEIYAETLEQARRQAQIEEDRKRLLKLRQQDYAERVKEQYLPKLPEPESDEEKKPVEEPVKKRVSDPEVARKKGIEYLEMLRNLPKKRKNSMQRIITEQTPEERSASVQPTPKKDYLVERRNNYIKTESNRIDRIIKSTKIPEVEKQNILLKESERLERKANMLSNLTKVVGGSQTERHRSNSTNLFSMEKTEEADKLYVDLIKAKIKILEGRIH